jgi:hypothetical protein
MKVFQLVTVCATLLLCLSVNANENDKLLPIDSSTFQCIKDMTKVRGFYVDNLDKKSLSKTLDIANKGQGTYPEGSVIQLVPTEVMVKHPKGTNPSTNDWEFFELSVSKTGSAINVRGFDDVKNRFNGNCLDCHVKAKPEFDMVCEQGHGCDPIPITPQMTAVLQKTDPRCTDEIELSEQELTILKQLKAAFGN